jgi:excisionase family DNA binding protein
MEQESLPADTGEQQCEHRYLRYPSISTISRKVTAGTDVRQKIRYFRKLIIRLDGDIGERELLLRELRLDGEPEDAPRRELEIDRLKHLRNYVAAQLEFIEENPLDDSGGGDDEAGAIEPSNDDPAEAKFVRPPSDDDILTAKELARLLHKSVSWIYKQSSSKTIPLIKIGGHLRFRRGDINEWIRASSQEPL